MLGITNSTYTDASLDGVTDVAHFVSDVSSEGSDAVKTFILSRHSFQVRIINNHNLLLIRITRVFIFLFSLLLSQLFLLLLDLEEELVFLLTELQVS